MAINHYFNNYNSKTEQWLIEDLIVESIQIMGADAYYVPIENTEDRDVIYGEDVLKRFQNAYPIEIYLSDAMDPGLEKDFFSKFGLQIQNSTRVILSRRSFSFRVPQSRFSRPMEGDLIYIPFLKGTGELYEIKFVNVTKDIYVLGRKYPYFYELELELFKYSQEQIETGIQDIDIIAQLDAFRIDLHVNHDGEGNFFEKEIVYQGETQETATVSATVAEWDKDNYKLAVINIAGVFEANTPIIGVQSGANYMLEHYEDLNLQVQNPFDNLELEEEGILYIDNSEINPFGNII